jgi:hypothetical protein
MRALRSQPPQTPNVKPEWRKALQLLARSPRGATEDVLELGHGFSRETLAKLANAPRMPVGGRSEVDERVADKRRRRCGRR